MVTGLVGVANAVIYDATPANTTLVDNGVAVGVDALTLTGAPGSLVLTNGNGAFNMGGFSSTSDINTLQGTPLTINDTVSIKLTVDSVSPIANLRANGIAFGMVYDPVFGATAATAPFENLLIGAEAANSGSDIVILNSSFQDTGGTGSPDATNDGIADGFTMTLTANVSGYTFLLEGLNASITPITVSGTFSGNEFLTYFGTGHFYYAAQKWDGSGGATPAALVSVISEASIDVFIQTDPLLELAPSALSLELFAPDANTTGTITAVYGEAAGSSADIEIVSLVASNGFNASMAATTLGQANTNEDITVTFTNAVGLAELGDATNSTLAITWTVVGSGVTNISEAALNVSYYPDVPALPDHGLVLFEAATDNTTMYNNGVLGDASNVTLTGATPDLLLAVDGGNFYVGGFSSTDTISNLLGSAVTDDDTVMMSLTVDSVTHTDTSELRSRGIEFGMQNEDPNESFIVRVGGADNGTVILTIGTTNAAITSAVFRATAASVEDGFSSIIVADEAGFTIYFDGLLTTSGGPMYPVSGTFTNGYFANAFGGGQYFASVQKRLVGTTTVDISEATLSTGATAAPEIVGTSVSDGNFILQFTGTLGREYSVESKGDLVNGLWETETNIPSLPETPMTVELPTTDPAAFYRVVTP